MIRLIMTIESKGDDLHTRVETDGAMLATGKEIAFCEKLRDAIGSIAGTKVRSVQYTKDLPPSGGNKQQT